MPFAKEGSHQLALIGNQCRGVNGMVYLVMDGRKFLALFAKHGDAEAFMADILNDFPPHSRIVLIGKGARINGPSGQILAVMREYNMSELGIPLDVLRDLGLDVPAN